MRTREMMSHLLPEDEYQPQQQGLQQLIEALLYPFSKYLCVLHLVETIYLEPISFADVDFTEIISKVQQFVRMRF